MMMSSRLWIVLGGAVAALAVALVVMRPAPAAAAYYDSDGDGTADLAERLAGSDPHNAASTPESAGGELYLGRPLCSDGVDNDIDGLTDGADSGCVDSDRDFVDDPIEIDLGSDPYNFDSIPEDSLIDAILVTFGFITFQCNDGLDNDLDGLIDDADPGCAPFDTDRDGYDDVAEKTYGSDPNDPASVPEDDRVDPALCADGQDNDYDGLTDEADPGCGPHPTATPEPAEPTAAPGEATPTAAPVGGLPSAGVGGTSGNAADATAAALAGAGVLASFAGLALRRRRERTRA